MAIEFLEAVPTANDAGWPTTPENIYADDTAYAIATTTNLNCQFFGFDFSAIPETVTITGIRVRVDGDWHDAGGTALIGGRYQIELSWDSGGNWTTNLVTQLLRQDLQTSSFAGSSLYNWGHTWTRTEIVNTFRVRLQTRSTSVTGAPQWRADFLQVAVYYTADQAQNIYEQLLLTDRVETDPIFASVFENLRLEDTLIETGGTAVTDLQSTASAAFDNASRYQRTEGCVCQFEFGAAGPIFFIGDSYVVTDATDSSWVVKAAQPGLIGIDSITYSSDFGAEQRPADASIRIVNKQYGDNFSGTTKTLPGHLQGKSALGGKVTIYVMVKDTEWRRRVIFIGRIVDVEFGDLEIIIRANQIGSGGIPIPDQQVNENSFYYAENTYSGNPGMEGNKIPEKIGSVIPIGIGRFTVWAVDSAWDSGHIFTVFSGREKAATGVIAAMAGIKFPLMPAVAAVRNWTGRHSELSTVSGIVQGRSTPVLQQVYLFGSRKGTKNLFVGHGSPDETGTYLFGDSAFTTDQGSNLIPIYTWVDQRPAYDQGLPFVRDNSVRSTDATEPFKREDRRWLWQSAGGMDASKGSDRWTDGDAKLAFGVFVNLALAPDNPQDELLRLPFSAMALQVVAIPFDSTETEAGSSRGIDYNHGVEGVDVFNSKSLLTIKDLGAAVTIHYDSSPVRTGQASYQCRLAAPPLGDIWGIRVGGIYNNATSTGILTMRGIVAGPFQTGTVDPVFDHEGWPMIRIPGNVLAWGQGQHQGQNTTLFGTLDMNGGNYIRTTAASTYNYFNWWIFAPWKYSSSPPHYGRPGNGWIPTDTNPESGTYGPASPWEFMSWGWIAQRSDAITKWPWHVVFQSREISGDSDVILNKAWLEVVFKSAIAYDIEGITTTRASYERYQPGVVSGRYGYRWVSGKPALLETDQAASSSDVFISGDGPTLPGGEVVEKPADVAQTIIAHYGGSKITTGTDIFGSFDDAKLTNGSHRLALIVDRQATMAKVLGEVARQSMAIIDEQITDTGEIKYRMFVETDVPATDDPARIYRNDITFKFQPVDIFNEQFIAYSSSIEQVSSNIRIRYGWHIPSASWSGEMFLNKEGSNLLSESALYVGAAVATYNDYVQLENPQIYEYPDIWDPTSAERILKWLFNRQRRRLVTVDFTTYIRHSDIRVGHVIRFDSTMDTLIAYPGELGNSTWNGASDSRYFNVLGVSYSKDVDGFLRIKIMARECYTKPV